MRSLSNLIKSGRVEIGIPVKVGLSSYKTASVGKVIRPQPEQAKTESEPKIEEVSHEQEIENLEKLREELLQKYLQEAEEKAQNYYQSEMEKAYNDGLKSAEAQINQLLAEAQQKYDQLLEEALKIKEEAARDYKETIKAAEKEVIELSIYVAEKIINTEVNKSDDYIINIIKDAMERVVSKEDVILKLCPEDYITVISNKKYWMTKIKGLGEILIEEDSSLESGDCIVDTPYGTIDAGIKVRMDKIQKAIIDLMEKEA